MHELLIMYNACNLDFFSFFVQRSDLFWQISWCYWKCFFFPNHDINIILLMMGMTLSPKDEHVSFNQLNEIELQDSFIHSFSQLYFCWLNDRASPCGGDYKRKRNLMCMTVASRFIETIYVKKYRYNEIRVFLLLMKFYNKKKENK